MKQTRPGARIAWLGGRNKFWGNEKFILCEFERGTRARKIYRSLDQINKVRSKKSKGFSGWNRKFKRFFRPKTGDLKKRKRSSSQKRHKIWCQSTKNTNLDLDLRSRSPEPINFFGAQSSLGGAQFSFGRAQAVSWRGTALVCPPWRRVWNKPARVKILYVYAFFYTRMRIFIRLLINTDVR